MASHLRQTYLGHSHLPNIYDRHFDIAQKLYHVFSPCPAARCHCSLVLVYPYNLQASQQRGLSQFRVRGGAGRRFRRCSEVAGGPSGDMVAEVRSIDIC